MEIPGDPMAKRGYKVKSGHVPLGGPCHQCDIVRCIVGMGIINFVNLMSGQVWLYVAEVAEVLKIITYIIIVG